MRFVMIHDWLIDWLFSCDMLRILTWHLVTRYNMFDVTWLSFDRVRLSSMIEPLHLTLFSYCVITVLCLMLINTTWLWLDSLLLWLFCWSFQESILPNCMHTNYKYCPELFPSTITIIPKSFSESTTCNLLPNLLPNYNLGGSLRRYSWFSEEKFSWREGSR